MANPMSNKKSAAARKSPRKAPRKSPRKAPRKSVPPPPSPTNVAHEPFAIDGINARLFRRKGPTFDGVPLADPDYVFREDLIQELAWSIWPHDEGHPMSVALVGPKGSGKTSLVEQVAARCNIPVARVNLNVGTSVRHLKGRVGARDGGTYFIPGVVTDAMQAGKWLLLDEISGATPPVALSLFPVLEPTGAVFLEDAEPPRYVKRHPDFRIFVTDNTIGAEQEEARFNYGGTNLMNAALIDRIDTTLQIGYLAPEQEEAAVRAKAPGISTVVLEGMIRTARSVRSNHDLCDGFSIRMLVSWARRVAAGRVNADGSISAGEEYQRDPAVIRAAAEAAFLRKTRSRADRDAISEVLQRLFGG